MTEQEFRAKHANDPVLSQIQDLKETDLLKVLNGAYIAKRFFGRSRSWFAQKLNNNVVNGKEASFTEEELITLRNALDVLSIEISSIADDLI